MRKDLKDVLTNIVQEIQKLDININNGGCGWFAYYLSQELLSRNIFYKLVVFKYNNNVFSGKDYLNSSKLIKTLRKHPSDIPYNDSLSARHYMIKIDDYYIDGDFFEKRIPNYYKSVPKSASFVYPKSIREACLKGAWNPDFDTDYLTDIENIIKENFSKLNY